VGGHSVAVGGGDDCPPPDGLGVDGWYPRGTTTATGVWRLFTSTIGKPGK
jgi:hypothetical protein